LVSVAVFAGCIARGRPQPNVASAPGAPKSSSDRLQCRADPPVIPEEIARSGVAFPTDSPSFDAETCPSFSPASLGGRDQVSVLLRVWIDAGGAVQSVRVERTGGPEFDAAASRAMFTARFSPARLADGRPVRSVVLYTIRFVPPK
jgi:TonB family protein